MERRQELDDELGPDRVAQLFFADAGPRLRRVFAARFGTDVADDLTGEVLEYAWANWERLAAMDNPIGFLFSVGCSKARRYHRWGRRIEFPIEAVRPAESNVDIFNALRRLSADQRVAVLAVHGFGWTYAEVAAILATTETAVTNHVHRGLKRLRADLEDHS